jgi:hypothetical protein
MFVDVIPGEAVSRGSARSGTWVVEFKMVRLAKISRVATKKDVIKIDSADGSLNGAKIILVLFILL